MRNNKKFKYDMRRAIICNLVSKSNSNKGYFRYDVSIGERDGTITRIPAYGRDMQDALSRVVNIERTAKVESKLAKYPFIFFVLWMAIMVTPVVVTGGQNTPWFILYMFGAFSLLFLFAGWWQQYLDKGK